MTKLAPLLRERLLASGMAAWRGTLTLKLQDGHAVETVALAVGNDGIEVQDEAVGAHVIAGGQALAQLILGAEDAQEIVAVNGIEVEGDATRLLPVLFPALRPQMENQAL